MSEEEGNLTFINPFATFISKMRSTPAKNVNPRAIRRTRIPVSTLPPEPLLPVNTDTPSIKPLRGDS